MHHKCLNYYKYLVTLLFIILSLNCFCQNYNYDQGIDFYKKENKLDNFWIGSYMDRISEKNTINNEKELENYTMISNNFKRINTEKLIQKAINEAFLSSRATMLIIAHRLSTITHCDRILVFENGKIVEIGTHEKLLAKNGLYKKLSDAQTYFY